ncbi:RDD family protein [Nocardioides sp.]|uniref:RDD family protein n=1 Tax=Nocardioides sp. TaxID=35761 RepID=UPI002CAE4AE7|nr:RDD family protein [Nocardioides sp.]HXH78762.1 RDD family protein [Nocardioides sp.]
MIETASWARRLGAITVDWIACTLVVVFVMGPSRWSDDPIAGFYASGVFVLESALFTTLLGGSFGKLATRLRVIREDGQGRPIELIPALLRSIMIALVVPPLVFRPDGRGLHDMAVKTRTVRLADLRPSASRTRTRRSGAPGESYGGSYGGDSWAGDSSGSD